MGIFNGIRNYAVAGLPINPNAGRQLSDDRPRYGEPLGSGAGLLHPKLLFRRQGNPRHRHHWRLRARRGRATACQWRFLAPEASTFFGSTAWGTAACSMSKPRSTSTTTASADAEAAAGPASRQCCGFRHWPLINQGKAEYVEISYMLPYDICFGRLSGRLQPFTRYQYYNHDFRSTIAADGLAASPGCNSTQPSNKWTLA